MSIPNNKVEIKDTSLTVVEMAYIEGSLQVSEGEKKSDTVDVSWSGRVCSLTVAAQRKKTKAIADAFNAQCGGTAYEYAPDGGGGEPKELNFYFGVRVSFATAQGNGVATLYFAQGHYSTTNNWWVGGTGILSSGPSLTVPIGLDGTELLLPMKGTHKSFEFLPGKVQ